MKKPRASFIAQVNGVLALGAAWPGWPITILVMTGFGVSLHLNEILLTILSVQASVAAAVMDIRQRAQQAEEERRRQIDEARDALIRETVEDVEQLAIEIKSVTDVLLDMAQRAERSDRFNAKSMKMIITALESRADLYDFLKGGVPQDDRTRKATRRVGSAGKAHGRANRKRS